MHGAAGNLGNLASLAADPRHRFVKGSIGDSALVAALLAEHQPRAVLNFAAESHVDRSIDSPEPFIQTNVVGTQNVIDACLAADVGTMTFTVTKTGATTQTATVGYSFADDTATSTGTASRAWPATTAKTISAVRTSPSPAAMRV